MWYDAPRRNLSRAKRAPRRSTPTELYIKAQGWRVPAPALGQEEFSTLKGLCENLSVLSDPFVLFVITALQSTLVPQGRQSIAQAPAIPGEGLGIDCDK